MGRHGKNPRTWTTMLGLISVALVFIAVITLVIIDPGKPEAVCRFSSQNVTLEITGPDCTPIMRMVTDNTDRKWVSAAAISGEQFSQLYKGKDLVRIYGNSAFAEVVSDFFQARQWIVEAPSPTPA